MPVVRSYPYMAHRTSTLTRLAGAALSTRMEPVGLLALVFALCVVAGSLPGATGAAAGSPTPVAVAVASRASSPSPSVEATLTPSPTELPSEDPSQSPSPSIVPTPTPAPTPHPVFTFVALGDSLTAWPTNNPWPSRLVALDPYLRLLNNAGVPGNTTGQMLARFNRDVAAYSPDVMFLMGGTNDLGDNMDPDAAIANVKAMVDAAKAKGIRPILMTIPPDSYASMVDKIDSYNASLLHLANLEKVVIVDIHSPLEDNAGIYQPQYTVDGLHFSDAGCAVVANTVFIRVRRLGL